VQLTWGFHETEVIEVAGGKLVVRGLTAEEIPVRNVGKEKTDRTSKSTAKGGTLLIRLAETLPATCY